VAVGLCSPKQELVIELLMRRGLKVKTYIAIGATIDFESSLETRPPRYGPIWGWFYRFRQEPKRLFRRYFIKDSMMLFWIADQYVRGARVVVKQGNNPRWLSIIVDLPFCSLNNF
jgi:UDP-N-acetyl-D-mannosaminuronic acid transferase (WecB/TagA/CpsF family)